MKLAFEHGPCIIEFRVCTLACYTDTYTCLCVYNAILADDVGWILVQTM